MTPNPEHQPSVEQVVEACELYWLLNRLPRETVDEMVLELRGHLQAALADEKSVADVVGHDLEAFAATWQDAYPRPNPAAEALSTVGIGLAHAPVALLAFQHLVQRSWAFSVSWLDLIWMMLIVVVPLMVLQPGVLVAEMRSRPLQFLVWGLITLTVVVPATLSVLWPQLLFLWTWPLTLIIVLGASMLSVGLLRADSTRYRTSRATSTGRSLWWRSPFWLAATSALALLLWLLAGSELWNSFTAAFGALSLYSLWSVLLSRVVQETSPTHRLHI